MDLPPWASARFESEHVRYVDTPIRRAGGRFVWAIAITGAAFLAGAAMALVEIGDGASRASSVFSWTMLVVAFLLAVVFAAFSLMMTVWPWLSTRAMKHTLVVITDDHVVRLIRPLFFPSRRKDAPPREKSWTVLSCTAPSVTQRRTQGGRESATLVLNERVTERKRDGQMIYRWDALVGLSRADDGLTALLQAQDDAHAAIDAAATPTLRRVK